MGQKETINKDRKGKHLTWEERIQTETINREGYSRKDIGECIGRSERTVKRELERGWVTRRTGQYSAEERYSADRGQTVYEARPCAREIRCKSLTHDDSRICSSISSARGSPPAR